MSPCQSLEFYPTQRGKDTGVAIQLKRQIEAYKKNEQTLMNYHMASGKPSFGSVIPSVQRWLRGPGDSHGSLVFTRSESLGGGGGAGRGGGEGGESGAGEPSPKGKAICGFPPWKFTLICSAVEHRAPVTKELNYAEASPGRGGRLGRCLRAQGGCLAPWYRQESESSSSQGKSNSTAGNAGCRV